MKHIVRLLFVIALLTMVVGTAFADAPPAPTVSWGEFILGDPMAITGFGYAPGLHLNIGLYRPDTVGGYAWIWAPPAGRTATYYEVPPSIETRRQAEVYALDNGSWATVFMLPRDEAWYPCSFPLKWKCPGTYADEYRYWDPVDNPTADVVHPVWLVVYADDWTYAESIELTITGLYWYFSDIP